MVGRTISHCRITEKLGGDPDKEHISDGLTDSIIGYLSKIADLKVISRTSSGLYKNSEKSLPVIAEGLGVTTLLEGKVQLEGNRIRIMAQLIDAQEEGHIRGENEEALHWLQKAIDAGWRLL